MFTMFNVTKHLNVNHGNGVNISRSGDGESEQCKQTFSFSSSLLSHCSLRCMLNRILQKPFYPIFFSRLLNINKRN